MSSVLTTGPTVRDWRDGDRVDQPLLVRQVDRGRTRDGAAYVRLVLGDRSASVPGIMWSTTACEAGTVMHVCGQVGEHPATGAR